MFFMVSVSVSKKIGIEESIGIGFEKILVSEKVSVLVSKKFGIEKSIGIGIGKKLVSKKVSVSVSKKIGIGKKYRYRFRSDFGFRHTLVCARNAQDVCKMFAGCVHDVCKMCSICVQGQGVRKMCAMYVQYFCKIYAGHHV